MSNKYTVGDNEMNFHQMSFSDYDNDISDWLPGVIINGNKTPAMILDDEITIVVNEPCVFDRPWGHNQTTVLVECYEEAVEKLAKEYNLKQLHISIEPNHYGSVLLAFTSVVTQEEELKKMITEVFLDNNVINEMPNRYEDFMNSHWTLNEASPEDYETLDEYLSCMQYATETIGDEWMDYDVVEFTGYWNDCHKAEETA